MLLILPPLYRFINQSYKYFPLSLGYLAGSLQRNNLKFKWKINAHVNSINEESLDLMVKAGLDMVMVGIEVATDKHFKKIKKKISIEKIQKVIKLFKKKGLKHTVAMIYGFPFDDEESISRRNELLLKIDPQHVAANIFTPLPGSQLFDEWVTNNNIDVANINWIAMTGQSPGNKYATKISDEKYEKLILESYKIVDYINKKNQGYSDNFFGE